jgi:allantoate deiminase
MRQTIEAFGLDPGAIGKAARQPGEIHAYAELHIEQGPVLEVEDLPVGVVTAISGASRFLIELEGMAGHAGTVPMNLRRDALAGAAACITAIESRCGGHPGLVGTVGQILAEPGATNVIPGRVRFTIDIRAGDDGVRNDVVSAIVVAVEEIAANRKLKARITRTHENDTALCAPWLRGQLADAIRASGGRVVELPSGAGHDGMAMADITDIAMLFVRCRNGVSHHPDEHVAAEDVEAGARVLLAFIENFQPQAPR